MANVLVTGANRGVGLEICRQLHERGDMVIAVCRRRSPALGELARDGARVIQGIDVANPASPRALAQLLADERIDVLVNNAGLLTRETLEDLDFDRMLYQYQVNALGPLRITAALLDNLAEGSKVAILTSRVGSIADNNSGGNYGYRMSKAAVNMAGANLALDLEPKGIAVILLHPGYVATEMTGGQGIPVADAAAGLIERIDELVIEDTGSFRHAEGYELPW